MSLKTDYKDDVFTGNRKYEIVQNGDNTVSFVDRTTYEQEGDRYGAQDLNNTNRHLVAGDGLDFQFSYDNVSQKHGYLDGQGNFVPFRTTHTGTYTAQSRGAALDMGEDHEYRYVNTNNVPNSNSGTVTISDVYTSGNGYDMGATNTKRFVKTSGLMKTPTANKSITANGNNIDVLNYSTVSVNVSKSVRLVISSVGHIAGIEGTTATVKWWGTSDVSVYVNGTLTATYTVTSGTSQHDARSIDNSDTPTSAGSSDNTY